MAKLHFHNFSSIIFVTVLCLIQDYRVNCIECGTVNVTRPLVQGGNETLRTEWPFVVALFEVRPTRFFCGGTLISNRHILTAAHCIHRRNSPVKLSPEDIEVRLGAYNLTVENEDGAVVRKVTTIYVHPDWKPYGDQYEGDSAVLVLSHNVTFSDYIQPICLPANDMVIDGAIIDVRGTVVGWGLAENEIHEEILRQMQAKAIKNSLCYRTDTSFAMSLSFRSFCAQGEDGSPNKGDSGGGFFVISKSTWVQYGIISAVRTNSTGHPTANSFSIYANVKSFKRWIVETVTQSGGEVGESAMKVTLACRYRFTHFGYMCEFNEFEIRNEHNQIASITGSHVYDYQDDNVESIHFNRGSMFTLPEGLGKVFKDVKILIIGNWNSTSMGFKHIWRSSFNDLESLVNLAVMDNDIETFDEDCLWDLQNLRNFIFTNNELKTIHEKSFDKNQMLMDVRLSENRLETLPKNLFKQNSYLQTIKLDGNSMRVIDEQIFQPTPNLFKIDLSSNQLEVLPRNLFQSNLWLDSVQLDNNSLRSIDEHIFETNSNLRTVSLSSNRFRLEYLPGNLFQNNSVLENVRLAKLSLKTIDEHMFENNVQLTSIDLSLNQLEVLPRNLFKNNLFLEHLNLSFNSFQTMDEHMFETNVNLKMVYLAFNRLEVLPGNLFKSNLFVEFVSVKDNALRTIDGHIFEGNEKLIAIDLSLNQLENLPPNLFKNQLFLTFIDINGNSLRAMDEHIFETNAKLVKINLRSNKLEFLPKKLFQNNFLVDEVDLSNNFLTSIAEEIFEKNGKLKSVYLTSNQLQSLPNNLFKNNPQLELLEFSQNSLKTINEQMFETNINLKIVHLKFNQLEYLPRNLFKNNLFLKELNCRGNKLKVIEVDFTELRHINDIVFYGNDCLNAVYNNVIDDFDDDYLNFFNILTEFQDLLNTNCSSHLLI